MVNFDGKNFRCTKVQYLSTVVHCDGFVFEGEVYKDGRGVAIQELTCMKCATEYDINAKSYRKFLKRLTKKS